jgi:hypothetical protein
MDLTQKHLLLFGQPQNSISCRGCHSSIEGEWKGKSRRGAGELSTSGANLHSKTMIKSDFFVFKDIRQRYRSDNL